MVIFSCLPVIVAMSGGRGLEQCIHFIKNLMQTSHARGWAGAVPRSYNLHNCVHLIRLAMCGNHAMVV